MSRRRKPFVWPLKRQGDWDYFLICRMNEIGLRKHMFGAPFTAHCMWYLSLKTKGAGVKALKERWWNDWGPASVSTVWMAEYFGNVQPQELGPWHSWDEFVGWTQPAGAVWPFMHRFDNWCEVGKELEVVWVERWDSHYSASESPRPEYIREWYGRVSEKVPFRLRMCVVGPGADFTRVGW